MEGEEPPLLGRRVVVYGGGDTAMDAARTAKRLGAEEAIVVYRRTRERMPAHDFEVEEALEEGVLMRWLSTIKHAEAGGLCSSRWSSTRTGYPQPTGETEELEADSLVLALGQETDLSLLDGVPGIEIEDGVVQVDERMMTGHEGDLRRRRHGARRAHRDGRRSATASRPRATSTPGCAASPVPRAGPAASPRASTCSTPGTTRTRPKTVAPQLDPVRRQSTFDEVALGLDETNALFEARRCMRCGNCFACDNCYGVCPDNAVIKLSRADGYAFDLDYCKGCGICAEECPCGAIQMEPEES